MTRFERIVCWVLIVACIPAVLYCILPAVGLAVVVMGLVCYGLCCLFERALRRVWGRR